jgi:hypothetical protein
MNEKEIKSYCDLNRAICVYRKRVKKAQFIVQSIYIHSDGSSDYRISVKFDPMEYVDQGEGYQYISKGASLEKIILVLEEFSGEPMSDWENFTKTGRVPFYDSEEITIEHHHESWRTLTNKYKKGMLLLPEGLEYL